MSATVSGSSAVSIATSHVAEGPPPQWPEQPPVAAIRQEAIGADPAITLPAISLRLPFSPFLTARCRRAQRFGVGQA